MAPSARRAPRRSRLVELLPAGWRSALEAELTQPYFAELEAFLEAERREHTILPPEDKTFAALERTPLEKVKVVLIGQDPYPTVGNANGLCFSVERGKAIPGSLRNMFKVLEVDVGATRGSCGDLTPWADQGVLLLNTVLTVREGASNSHKGRGWERFTRAVLEVVNARCEGVVFLLLGKHAQSFAELVDSKRHVIVTAPHPSPASPGNPFGKTRPFSAVNRALEELGRAPIDWQLPNA